MKRILALQLLACLAIWSADANTITSQTQAFTGGSGAFNNPLTFTRFDTSLGTLTAVTISMTAEGYGILILNNPNGTARDFTGASASVPVQFVGPDGLQISTTLTAGPFTGSVDGKSSTSIKGPTWNDTVSHNVQNGNWGLYSGLGAGSFDLTAHGDVGTYTYSGTADGHASFSGSETVSGNVTITYTFNAVPDGGLTAMLLGMGMLALGTVRRMVK